MAEQNQVSKEMFENRFKLNFKYLFIGLAAFIPTLILFIVNAVTDLHSQALGWAMFAIFVPYIMWALFMAQKMDLVGAYGETILLLIPTFVWLLPSHDQAIWVMIIVSFALIVIGAIFYAIGRIGSVLSNQKSEAKWRALTPILIRLSFVAMSVVATLIVSIILINWGDWSLKLVPTDPTDGSKDYTVSAWIVFLAVITITVALMLVMLGLASQFNFYFIRQNEKSVKEAVVKSVKKDKRIKSEFLNRTIQFKTIKKKWWRRK